MNVISLFTGAGGLDIGFMEAGYKDILSSDIMPQAQKSYLRNYPKAKYLLKDICQVTTAEIKSLIGKKTVDVIIGGPPCQGFSNMGNKNSADPRNLLFESYVRIVNELRPKCFLFENVKGLYTMFEGRFFKKVVSSFLSIGYNIHFSVIDASKYGVPQKRERVIIVGTTIDRPFRFPAPDTSSFGNIKAYAK